MIYIEQNAVNNIFVNVSQYKTGDFGANPRYLWRLQNAQGRNIVSFYPENSTNTYPSAYTGRYDVFTFNTFKNQPENYNYSAGTDCNLHLVNENQYWLGIYEMPPNSTSYNPSSEKLLNSLAFIFVPVNNEFYTGNTANVEPNKIYYKNDANATISVYSQVLDFISPAQYNSIVYRCDGTPVKSCYSCDNQYNITDLVALFNTPPTDPLPGCCLDPTYCYCWTDYGTYYDNGDGRIRCEMPTSVYNNLCSGGAITLEVIYD